MYCVLDYDANICKVIDTKDGVVDVFDKAELIRYNKKYNLDVKGIVEDRVAYSVVHNFTAMFELSSITSFRIKTSTNLAKVKALYRNRIYKDRSSRHILVIIDTNKSATIYTDLDLVFCSNCNSMFFCCEKLKSADLSYLYLFGAVDTSYMFANCIELEQLDLGSIDLSTISCKNNMFANCKKLNSV